MAAQTLTASTAQSGIIPKQLHAGLVAVSFAYNSGATKFGTVSDALFLAKIPHGATIHDMVLRYHQKADTQFVGQVLLRTGSTSAEQIVVDTFTASATGGAVTVRGNGFPRLNSHSDADTVRHGTLILNVQVGTETVSVSLAGTVFYSMDGNQN